MKIKFRNFWIWFKDQIKRKRVVHNFFISRNAWGAFSINSHIRAATGKPKITYSSIESALKAAEKRKQTITKDKLKCENCGHCFKPNPKKQYVIKHIVNKPTYWDSGYGEDDRYADFEVTDIYENCPKCQSPIAVKLAWYEEQIPGTEKDRRGNRYD